MWNQVTFLFASHSYRKGLVIFHQVGLGKKKILKDLFCILAINKEKRDCLGWGVQGKEGLRDKRKTKKLTRGKPHFSGNFDSENVDTDAKFLLLISGLQDWVFHRCLAKLLRRIIFFGTWTALPIFSLKLIFFSLHFTDPLLILFPFVRSFFTCW